MTPEEYLAQLVGGTPGGWLATSSHSELRKMTDNMVRQVIAQPMESRSSRPQGTTPIPVQTLS